MRPRLPGLVLAAVTGLIALSLPSQAVGAGGSTSPAAPLIHHFPLGTQTLSHTTSARAGGSRTTHHRGSATPSQHAPAASAHRASTAQAARHHRRYGVLSILFVLTLPALVVAALLSRVAIRRSRRGTRRRADVNHRPSPGPRPAARWAFEDKDELERNRPPLPIRPRTK